MFRLLHQMTVNHWILTIWLTLYDYSSETFLLVMRIILNAENVFVLLGLKNDRHLHKNPPVAFIDRTVVLRLILPQSIPFLYGGWIRS